MRERPSRPTRREVLIASGATALTAGSIEAAIADPQPQPIVNVRSYGAKGDGRTNDTDAFLRAAATINANGGGTILIPPGTYIVGKQTLTGAVGQGAAWRASPIIRIAGCTRQVLISGLGAASNRPILKAANGLRFGSFDPVGGAAITPALPFTDRDYQANAYLGMIELQGNAAVSVSDLELDGNIDNLTLGGAWGDTGRQCSASGVWCYGNQSVAIENVHTHHHGLDGVIVGYTAQPPSAVTQHTLTDVVSEYNARQGLSWVGASGLVARRCRFAHTGRGRFASAPGAGVDVEPEETQIVGGLFEDCEIADNIGPGLVSDGTAAGSSVSGVTFRRTFIHGTTTYALLVRNPDFEFDGCRIVGALATNPASTLGPEKIRFVSCRFDDLEPQSFRPGLLIDCSVGESVLLRDCVVETTSQRLCNFGNSRILRTRFIARLITEFATGPDWIGIVYGSRVENCIFEDRMVDRTGPVLTINYSNSSTMIGNAVLPPLGRIALFNAS